MTSCRNFLVILSTIFLGEKGAFGLKGLVALVFVSVGIYIVNMKTKVDNDKSPC